MNNAKPSLMLFVPWTAPSENVVRSRHWSQNHKDSRAAKDAYVFALRSSPAAVESWTTITSLLAASRSEMPLPEASESMTQTQESSGATGKPEQTEKQEPS